VSSERHGTADTAGASAFASGMSWKLTTQVVTQATRIGVAILLARLMSPFEFGVAGLALVFAPLAYVFTDLGAALVQQRDQTENDRSTAFWTSLAVGTVITLLGIAAAGPIARFYGEPEVQNLFIVLSASFVVTAATTTHSALLHRALAFRQIELANMISVIGASAVAVTVALLGGGAWAIVLQLVGGAVLLFCLLWVFDPWRPHFRYSWASLRSIASFTAHNTGANLLHYFERNTDNLLIGRFLGPSALGLYSIAYNLMLYPVTRLADPVHQVLFPLLSRIQDDDARVARVWLRVTRSVAAIVAPLMVGLVILAPEFIRVLLGAKWDGAVPIVQILALAGLVYAVRIASTSVLLATGRARALFHFSLVSAVVLVTGFAITVQWGVNAVAASFTASFVVLTPVLVWLAARAVGSSLRVYAVNLLPVTAATVIMTVVVILARHALLQAGASALVVLLLATAVGAAVYTPLCLWLAPDLRSEIATGWSALRRRARSDGGGEPSDQRTDGTHAASPGPQTAVGEGRRVRNEQA
jgi:O-antigen/teichoic acid export membrane protein